MYYTAVDPMLEQMVHLKYRNDRILVGYVNHIYTVQAYKRRNILVLENFS